jgi:hypothetical protein
MLLRVFFFEWIFHCFEIRLSFVNFWNWISYLGFNFWFKLCFVEVTSKVAIDQFSVKNIHCEIVVRFIIFSRHKKRDEMHVCRLFRAWQIPHFFPFVSYQAQNWLGVKWQFIKRHKSKSVLRNTRMKHIKLQRHKQVLASIKKRRKNIFHS